MNPQRPTVLILSDHPEFARAITEAWPDVVPEFTLLEQDLGRQLLPDVYDLAVADVPPGPLGRPLMDVLSKAGKPVIAVCSDKFKGADFLQGPILLMRRESQSWASLAGLLGREVLRRRQAELRWREAERARTLAQGEATLGRYMVEMRHSVNNALTSVLGNAELLQAEPGLPASVQAQADTIRNMALRLHEIFQRFSSIENELNVAAREASKKTSSAAAPPERGSAASA